MKYTICEVYWNRNELFNRTNNVRCAVRTFCGNTSMGACAKMQVRQLSGERVCRVDVYVVVGVCESWHVRDFYN